MRAIWICDVKSECWQVGWIAGRYWLSVIGYHGTVYLDVGTWRIRWAARDFVPLFSERQGLSRWYGIGRLKARRAKRSVS